MRGWAAIGAAVGAGIGSVGAAVITPLQVQGLTRAQTYEYGTITGMMLGAAIGAFIGAGSPTSNYQSLCNPNIKTGVGELQREWHL